MDAKRMFIGMVLIIVVGLGWQYFLLYEYRLHPEWRRPGAQATTNPSGPTIVSSGVTGPTTNPVATTQSVFAPVVPTTMPAAPVLVGSNHFKSTDYRMALSISPNGAGLDSVALNQFTAQVDKPDLYVFQTPYEQDTNSNRSLATTAIDIDGNRVDLSDRPWMLVNSTNHSATYAVDLMQAGKPAVRVEKEFVLDPASTDPATSQGYEIQVNYHLHDLSAQPHNVSLEFNGPTVPRAETARQETEIVAGYDEDESAVKMTNQPLSQFNTKITQRDYLVNSDGQPLLWIGASSTYFNAIVRPLNPKQLAGAVGFAVNPASPNEDRLVSIRFTTQSTSLSPGGDSSVPLRVFFGPKLRSLLDTKYYATFPIHFDDTVVFATSWICAFCTFPWLISFLVFMLYMLHLVLFKDWGLAIIALVGIVRLILHPITKRSQVSMMKMQKLAPEIERLKKKFGDDKEGFAREQMELYKSVGFTPILGCLPMFLQLPIFMALWQALQTTFELRQAPFLEFFGIHFTWIHDLSMPDGLWKFAGAISLPFGIVFTQINILPIAMAVVTFINQKYFMPRPAALTPEQEQQQKMMTWMTLLFPLMFYRFPSGLNLYYLTSTSLGIIESKVIRRHIKQREDADKASGQIIVDAGKPSRAVRRRERDEKSKGPPAAKSWIVKLQEKAERLAREAEQKRRKGKA
jgi:YidC/Oxa1 family membrane protein insertase